MINIGSLIAQLKLEDKLTPALKRAQTNLNKTGARMTKLGGQMQATGSQMTMGLTAPIVGLGAAAGIAFGSFEKSMNRVKALTGATGGDFKLLENQAKELGKTTKFSAGEAADAMGFLGMAGFKTTEIYGAMPNVLELAAAATLDVASAADITSNIMTGFGQTTEDLAHTNNVLVKAFTSANTDLTQLGVAFRYAGPVARSAGLSFESTAAAIALMGNAGIQGSMAGTSLRGAITKLLGPTSKARKEMRTLGLNVTDSTGKIKPMDEIVRQLGSSSATTEQLITIFGQRAGPAMAALVGQGSDALKKMTGDLEGVGNIAKEIAETQMEGLAGTFTLMQSAATGALIEIGEVLAPMLTSFLEIGIKISNWVSDTLVPAFGNLSPGIQKLVLGFVALLAAIGPILMAAGTVTMLFGSLATALGSAGLVGTIGALLAPIGAVVAAIGAWPLVLGALLLSIKPVRDILWEWAQLLTNIVIVAFKGVVGALKGLWKVWVFVRDGISKHLVPQFVIDGVNGLINGLKGANEWLSRVGETADDEAARGVKELAETIEELDMELSKAGIEGSVAELEAAMHALSKETNGLSDDALAGVILGIQRLQAAGEELTPSMIFMLDKFEEEAAAAKLAAEGLAAAELETQALDEATQALNDQISAQVSLWTQGAIPAANAAIAAFEEFGDITQLTQADQEKLADTLEDGLEKYRLMGREAPAAMQQVARSIRDLHRVLDERPLLIPLKMSGIENIGQSWRETAKKFQKNVSMGITIPIGVEVGMPPPPVLESFGQTAARHFRGGFSDIVKGLPDTIIDAFKGGGGIAGAMRAVATQIGSVMGGGLGASLGTKLGQMAEGAGGMFGKLLGGLSGMAGPIGAAVGAMAPMIIEGFKKLFSGPTVQESVTKTVQRTMGIGLSEGLANAIAETRKTTRSDFGALMLHISDVIEDGGGVVQYGVGRSISAVRDIFVAIETHAVTATQAAKEFGKAFGDIANVVVESGEIASKGFTELLTLANEFGTTAATIKFVGEQSKLAAEGIAAMGASGVKTQEELEDLGTIAVASFEAALAAGMSFTEAVRAHGPALDMVIAQQEKLGVTSENVALQQLVEFRDRVTQNETLVKAVEALDDTMLALSRTGALNAETMASLERQGLRMYDRLIEAGFSQQEAISQLGPSLRLIMEAHEKLGIPITANTQKLIDQAKEAGALEAQQKTGWGAVESAVLKVVESLDRFMERLGGIDRGLRDLPREIHTRIRVTEEIERGSGGGGYAQENFQHGTGGKFLDFGAGTPAVLHGKERVQTLAEGQHEAAGLAGLEKRLESIETLLKNQPRAMGVAISDSLTLIN